MGLLTLDERYYCGEEEFKVNGTVRFFLFICPTLTYFSIDVSVPKILLSIFYTSIHTNTYKTRAIICLHTYTQIHESI